MICHSTKSNLCLGWGFLMFEKAFMSSHKLCCIKLYIVVGGGGVKWGLDGYAGRQSVQRALAIYEISFYSNKEKVVRGKSMYIQWLHEFPTMITFICLRICPMVINHNKMIIIDYPHVYDYVLTDKCSQSLRLKGGAF